MDKPWQGQQSKTNTLLGFRSGRPFLAIMSLQVPQTFPTWAFKSPKRTVESPIGGFRVHLQEKRRPGTPKWYSACGPKPQRPIPCLKATLSCNTCRLGWGLMSKPSSLLVLLTYFLHISHICLPPPAARTGSWGSPVCRTDLHFLGTAYRCERCVAQSEPGSLLACPGSGRWSRSSSSHPPCSAVELPPTETKITVWSHFFSPFNMKSPLNP